ncbi:MAG TPA: MoaD/ThiS family protein [Pseudomonadales bacterium]|nr:MoaD/ThiS family protein [Pseudomonadales bacterium]
MIYIKYFAKYRELMQMASEELLSNCNTLAALKLVLRETYPQAGTMLDDPRCITAINQQIVKSDSTPICPGDEVAFYPPVSGG